MGAKAGARNGAGEGGLGEWSKEERVNDAVARRIERAVQMPMARYQAEEYERLWVEFMGLEERQRWALLRSWEYWKEEELEVVALMEKLKEGGILAVNDDDIARMHLHAWRTSGKRPKVQQTTLAQLQKLREGSWQRECVKERARTGEAEAKARRLEREVKDWEKKFDSELAAEKKRVEEETRRVVVDQMRAEFELRERVKGGVEEAFGTTGATPASDP
jgi:hypothetical protein